MEIGILFYTKKYSILGDFMNELKKIGISLGFSFLFLFISTFLITIFNYSGLFSSKATNIFKLIFLILSLFIGGFISGKKASKNGWLEGIKLGSIFMILFLLSSILLQSFHMKNIIFYCIILGSTTFGSMVGINKQEDSPKG